MLVEVDDTAGDVGFEVTLEWCRAGGDRCEMTSANQYWRSISMNFTISGRSEETAARKMFSSTHIDPSSSTKVATCWCRELEQHFLA